MSARPIARLICVCMAPALLAACGPGRVQETFGLGVDRAPDEFQVVRRAPLVVPPDYRLRPPEPGSIGPQATTPGDEAYAALTGQEPQARASMSAAEQAVIEATPGRAMPNIRQVIAEEGPQLAVLDRSTFLFILSWQRGSFEQSRLDVLDPQAESARLREQGIVSTARSASTPFPQ
jgi:hypothetical protein